MGAIWAVISLLAVWLIYGLIASIFVKGVTSRDGLKLIFAGMLGGYLGCLLYTSPSPRDLSTSRMPSSA